MNICYYNEHVKEELDDARHYAMKAVEEKLEHPDWSAMYAKLAESELVHAKSIIDIFEDDYKHNKTDDPIYEQIHSSIIEMYTEFSTKVTYILKSL